MATLAGLAPQAVWDWFQFICDIPHPSKHEQKLSQAIQKWVEQQKSAGKQLDILTDEVGNLLIRKPATKGMQDCKAVVLQAHLDMVPQKNEDKNHDFINDPIEAYVDNEWVTANGTTLGADNGIGLAVCLAVLADENTISHPDLEVLFTISEETGMDGARGLQPDWLKGTILINTDSEQEGDVYVGCAGGVDFFAELPMTKVPTDKNSQTKYAINLKLKGLKGGHSGCDIHLGRGNAIQLLAVFLAHELDIEYDLAHFAGGSVRNAIPREASCCLVLNKSDKSKFEQSVANYLAHIQEAYQTAENAIKLVIDEAKYPEFVCTEKEQKRLLNFISASPNSVMTMSSEFANVVESSLNIGVVSNITAGDNNFIQINYLVRSLSECSKLAIVRKLESLSQLAEISYSCKAGYPGWQPNISSPVMNLFLERYEKNYGHKPNINVIHAGLECGLFQNPYPNMDMLSFGPTINYPHSPDEKVNIHSVELFWEQLIDLLKHIPKR